MWSEVQIENTDFSDEFENDLSYLWKTKFIEYRSNFDLKESMIHDDCIKIHFPNPDDKIVAVYWKIHGIEKILNIGFMNLGFREKNVYQLTNPYQYLQGIRNKYDYYMNSFSICPSKIGTPPGGNLKKDVPIHITLIGEYQFSSKSYTPLHINENAYISVLYQLWHPNDFVERKFDFIQYKNYIQKKEIFRDIHQELIVKTWHPHRVNKWCLIDSF